MSDKSTVCVVMTVYNPEQNTLSRIVQRLRQIGVTHLVIINNGGLALAFDSDSFVTVHSPPRNLGTAGGYKLGMTKANQAGYDFIWLLDDDNLPDIDALSILLSEFEFFESSHARNRLMLLSSRPHLFKTVFIHKKKNVYSIGPKEKSYLGFHYSQLFEMFKSRLLGVRSKYWSNLKNSHHLALDTAYFGGLFFHSSLVNTYSELKSNLFIYWDDLDFTNRFCLENGAIYLIPKSVINDIGPKNDHGGKKHFLHHPFMDLQPRFKAFYYMRNLSIYEKRWSTSYSVTYRVNKTLMMSMLWSMAFLQRKPDRFSLLIKSIRCAQRSEFQ